MLLYFELAPFKQKVLLLPESSVKVTSELGVTRLSSSVWVVGYSPFLAFTERNFVTADCRLDCTVVSADFFRYEDPTTVTIEVRIPITTITTNSSTIVKAESELKSLCLILGSVSDGLI